MKSKATYLDIDRRRHENFKQEQKPEKLNVFVVSNYVHEEILAVYYDEKKALEHSKQNKDYDITVVPLIK